VKFSNGVVKHMHPHTWQSEEYPTLSVAQIPLCLAWALTIHKIQGATLQFAEIDVGNSVFEYGQTYVALSRVQSLDGLYLSAFNYEKIQTNPSVIQFYENISSYVHTNAHNSEETYLDENNSNSDIKRIEL
jgi:ATP-dependent DNA helicase PIF1